MQIAGLIYLFVENAHSLVPILHIIHRFDYILFRDMQYNLHEEHFMSATAPYHALAYKSVHQQMLAVDVYKIVSSRPIQGDVSSKFKYTGTVDITYMF